MDTLIKFIQSMTPQQWVLVVIVIVAIALLKAVKKKVFKIIQIIIILAIVLYFIASITNGSIVTEDLMLIANNYVK